jgi:hypothetical protein
VFLSGLVQALRAGVVPWSDEVIDPVLGRCQLAAGEQQREDDGEVSGERHCGRLGFDFVTL